MRKLRAIPCVVPLAALLCATIARADLFYTATLDTAPLKNNAAGPFILDFQFVDGGTLNNNTVTLTDFQFHGGSANTSGATITNGAALNTPPLSIALSDTSFFNELQLPFTPGSLLSFQISTTTNLEGPGNSPDSFTFAVLDNSSNEIPTTNPNDSLLEIDLDSRTSPTTFLSASVDASVPLPAPTLTPASAVPEPSFFWFAGIGLAAVFLGRRVAAKTAALAILLAAGTSLHAQFNVSLVVGDSTPKPGGGTFSPVTTIFRTVGPSLDGDNLLFPDFSNALWVMNTATSQFHEVIAGGASVPGINGTIAGFGNTPFLKLGTVAFVGINAYEGIYTIPVNGGPVSLIADHSIETPDGRGLFSIGYQLGGGANSNDRISLDGAHIAFDPANPPQGIYVANLDGTSLKPLAPNTQGLLCFLFNPANFLTPAIWGTHYAFQGSNVFDFFWFFTATYPPGVVSPPVPACSPNGPLNYPATVDAGATLPGGVVGGNDNSPFGVLIDDTQIYFSANGGQGLYTVNYDGDPTTIQTVLAPGITLPNFDPPYTVTTASADAGSIAFDVTGPTSGEALFIYSNGVFHRVVGTGDTLEGVVVPGSPGFDLSEYGLSGGKVAFAITLLADGYHGPRGEFLATPTYCADDVTAVATISLGGFRYNHSTNQFVQTVTVTNKTAQAIAGPVSLVLKNLSSGITLANKSGSTSCSGSSQAYIVISGGEGLAPGASTTVTLTFNDSSFTGITYTPGLLSGVNR